MLRRLGVRRPRIGVDGSFNVTPGTFRLISFDMVENTNPVLRSVNAAPYPDEIVQFLTPMANSPACDVLPCPILRALDIRCCEERVTWIDPDIVVDAIPTRIPEATVFLNPFNARVEGDIRLQAGNDSEQGERCTEVVCKCRAGRPKDCDPVDGSATVDGEDEHRVVIDRLDELLDEVTAGFSNVEPETEVDREAEFEKEGALETIEAILDILTTGTIRVNADIQVTASVRWRGRRRTRQFDIDAEARLPVDNVNYRW